jgi:hypothetical protein
VTRSFARLASVVLIALGIVAAVARPVSACSFARTPLPASYDQATDVFVGYVEESFFRPDGTIDSAAAGRGVRFSVRTRYKGTPAAEMVDSMDSNCAFPFVKGRTYLVMGVSENGRFVTGKQFYPLQLSPPSDLAIEQPQAALTIKYAEARANRQPQGFLYGSVSLPEPKQPRAAGASDRLLLRAVSDDGRAVTVAVPNYMYGYGVSLPPGRYVVSLVKDGAIRSSPTEVRIPHGKGVELNVLSTR